MAQALSSKINKWNLMKTESFYKIKDKLEKTNCKSRSDGRVISKSYEELKH